MPSTTALERPRVFVGSSSEGLDIAKALQVLLDRTCEVEIWDQGVFEPGGTTLPSLIAAAHRFDFAIFVVSPDDVTDSRGSMRQVPRDNVIFELGLFMGTVGPARSFMVHERDSQPSLPSDLAGVTRVSFQLHRSGNVLASLGAAATMLEDKIKRTGLIAPSSTSTVDADRDTGLDGQGNSDSRTLDPILKRWFAYAPHNEQPIKTALRGLAERGFRATLPGSRGGGSSKTYLKVLRPDGRNIGYMNSSSFVFLDNLLQDSGELQQRYSWSEPGAVASVLALAERFRGR